MEKQIFATIMITDLVGFTEFSRRQTTKKTFGQLKEYFSIMEKITKNNKGTVDKTMGDGLLCYFASEVGDYVKRKDMAIKAAKAAIEMKIATSYMNSIDYEKNPLYVYPEKDLKVFLNSGKIWKGEIFKSKGETIIGPDVNLTSRIEKLVEGAQSYNTQPIAVNQKTYNLIHSEHDWCTNPTYLYESNKIKGFGGYKLILYELLNRKKTIKDIVPSKLISNSQKKIPYGFGPFKKGKELYIDYKINPKEYKDCEKVLLQLPLLATYHGRNGDSEEWEVEFYLKSSDGRNMILSKRSGITFDEPKPYEYAPCLDLKEKQKELERNNFSLEDYLDQNKYKLRIFFSHKNDGNDEYWIQGIDSNKIRRIYWGIVFI